MKLKNRRILISGANQGFGLAVAHAMAAEGADLMLCARSAEKLDAARKEVESAGKTRVVATPTDISDPLQVQSLVQKTIENLGGLDVIVCNAGIHGPKGPVHAVDWDEWVQAISVNLLGTVLLCRAALPHMLKQKRGKIIVISGGGATKPMPNVSAYAASKAAVVRFSETLAEEVRTEGIDVNAVAPGAMNTRLLDDIINAGPEKVGKEYYAQALKQKQSGGTPLEKGAGLCVFLASDASNGISGKLISAVWDPWESLPDHLEDLKKTDVYTLRRIVPEERGLDWGQPR